MTFSWIDLLVEEVVKKKREVRVGQIILSLGNCLTLSKKGIKSEMDGDKREAILNKNK